MYFFRKSSKKVPQMAWSYTQIISFCDTQKTNQNQLFKSSPLSSFSPQVILHKNALLKVTNFFSTK